MSNGEDWLLRPVARGFIRAETLDDPSCPLIRIAELNELADVLDANTAKARRAMEKT